MRTIILTLLSLGPLIFTLGIPAPLFGDIKEVGVIAPLTGPLADIGITVRNCVSLRDEELDLQNKVEFRVEDDSFSPRSTVAALHKLMSTHQIEALMVFGSSTSLAVADIAERNKLPFLALGMSEKIAHNKKYVFRHFSTAQSQHRILKREITRRGYESIAIVTLAHEAMVNMRDIYLSDAPVPAVLSEEIIPGDSDLKSLAVRIRSKEPSAVYFLLLPPHISSLAKTLREIGYSGEFFGAAPFQQKGEIIASQGSLEDAWFAASDDSSANDFRTRYMEKFGSEPHPDGLPACDAAQFIIELSARANFIAALKEDRAFNGLFGSYRMDSNNTFDIPVTIKRVRGNEFVPLYK